MTIHEHIQPAPVEAQQGTTHGTHAAGGSIVTSWSIDHAGWLRFLARYALLAVIIDLVTWPLIVLWFIPASQGSPLPPPYDELMAATRNLAMYRVLITLDVAAWLMLGVFLITLAALFARHAPIRSALIAACGIGQVAGMSGAFLRLKGISDLVAHYVTAAPDQQAALLRSFLDLQLVINSLFTAGGTLWAIAFVLAASAAWSSAAFPRWLTVLIALPGVLNLTSNILAMVTGTGLPFVISILSIFLLTVVNFAVAGVFWRRGWTFSARPGKTPRLHGEPGTEA
jgi:hypothetical protein